MSNSFFKRFKKEEISEETEALGHNYVEGICTRCEKAEALASGTCGENLTWVLDEDGTLDDLATKYNLALASWR